MHFLIVKTYEELEHLILTHYRKPFILACSPDVARQVLERHNMGNRNIRPQNVERLARLMKGGHWKCKRGTMPLKFDTNGLLFGGQHRLEAVIIADMTVYFNVLLDLDPDLRDIEDDVAPHQNQDNDPDLKRDVTAICRALTGLKLNTDEERLFYAHYKVSIDAVRSMFTAQPGVKIAGVLAEFIKAYETVPVGKLKYIARVLCTGLPEGRKGDAVIIRLRDCLIKKDPAAFTNSKGELEYWPKIQSVIKTVNDERNPRSIQDLKQPVFSLEGDILEIIKNHDNKNEGDTLYGNA